VVLAAGDTFLIGKELVEFQFGGAGAGEGGWLLAGRKRVPISGQGLLLGRTQGDVTFADDPQVSTRHARVRREGRRWLLEDLGSTNGTYLKIRGRCRLETGDVLLCGSQLLRVR
jgi:pSer/pThr/pTyr-binding forkhead associated (FHA) protein